MQAVKNELALPNPSLAQESRAQVIAAPAENKIVLAARHIGELFHTKFDAWVSATPEDSAPNVRIHQLSAVALSPDALSMLARREEEAQLVRNSRRQR